MDTRIKDLKRKIYDIEKEIIKINSEQWKQLYTRRCKKNFMDFEKFIDDLAFWNSVNEGYNYKDTDNFRKECKINISEPTIPEILEITKSYGFENFNETSKMVCESCACQDCPSLKSHLGYTCKECKKNGFEGYNGYCDE